MNNRRNIIWMLLAVTLVCFSVVAGLSRLRSGERQLAQSVTRLAETCDAVETLRRLRQQEDVVASEQVPSQQLIAKVHTVLDSIGLRRQSASEIREEQSSTRSRVAGTSLVYRDQSMRVVLQGVTTSDVGDFLIAWRSNERLWRIDRVEMSHAGRGRGRTEGGTYDATFVITSTYVAYGGNDDA